MIGFNKLKSAILVATVLAGIGLGPIAVFADDGSGAEYMPEPNAAPFAGMSNCQTALQNIGSPLDQLGASCLPGVSTGPAGGQTVLPAGQRDQRRWQRGAEPDSGCVVPQVLCRYGDAGR